MLSLVIEMKRENRIIKQLTFKLYLIYWLQNFNLLPEVLSYYGPHLWVILLLDNEPIEK